MLDLIGGTPTIRLLALEPPGVRLYAKLEGFNPTGSIKDRTAHELVASAERVGALRPGMTVVEASSGNTGIGLAMVCGMKGHPLLVVMSKKASRERIAMLRAYGAELLLTSKEGGADEARRVADELAARDPRRYCRVSQHRSRENVEMHYRTTGQELVDQVCEPIDWFVSGIGTSATLLGVARRVREQHPGARIIGVQPAGAFNHQEGLRNVDLTDPPEIFDRAGIDRIVTVDDDEARNTARLLVQRAGVFCGISSGSVVAAALRLIEEGARGVFATILPDRGEKYLSTALYADAGVTNGAQ
ncbi:MAG: PLP-dependent cysteine synthase family protein [Deltaproteobacteria bacterium]|nr:PLP-dependent cysteine synthase family protein [Deltaproteobacteria bacterium]